MQNVKTIMPYRASFVARFRGRENSLTNMTLLNLCFFLAGSLLTGLGGYIAYLFLNMKKVATEKSIKELTTATSASYAPQWNKPHYPRLEDMF
jgi:hypothetical protein